MATRRRTKNSCPTCGSSMVYETRTDELAYKGHIKQIQTLAWWCGSCGEAILEGNALAASERAFLELKAEVDGIMTPAQVAEIRKRLRLSQRRAGELLGGGPRAFQKYEAGTVAVSQAMSNLLRLLDANPKLLKQLEQHTRPLTTTNRPPAAKTARLRATARQPSTSSRSNRSRSRGTDP